MLNETELYVYTQVQYYVPLDTRPGGEVQFISVNDEALAKYFQICCLSEKTARLVVGFGVG